MEFEDTMTITTPEGIDLQLSLAGLGSRFSAALVDLLIQGLLWLGVTVVWAAFGILRGWGLFAYTIIVFLVLAAYNTVFEVLASGRTPGKRLNGLRVVRVGGFPIGFLSSAIRNMLRLVDVLPTAYLVGCVAILVPSTISAWATWQRERSSSASARRHRSCPRRGRSSPKRPTRRGM